MLVAAFVALGVVGLAIWLFAPSLKEGSPRDAKSAANRKVKDLSQKKASSAQGEAQRARQSFREAINEKAKEFIEKPLTNALHFVGEIPLDPDDPDNALRTQTARDIATLLAIQPGEDVPGCIPMGFMFEDDAIETARLEGQTVIESDGGNKQFLNDLKKWKVTVKETDGDHVAAHKSKLVDAQLELLDGIKDGITVNDAIRAAYEFRVRAAEARRSMVDMITELRGEQGEDARDEDTLALIRKCNEKLAKEGIVEIDPAEIIEDYEPPEGENDKGGEE